MVLSLIGSANKTQCMFRFWFGFTISGFRVECSGKTLEPSSTSHDMNTLQNPGMPKSLMALGFRGLGFREEYSRRHKDVQNEI